MEGRGKSTQCVLTQSSFNSLPRIALGRAATTSLAGCRESECEKVSQAEEKRGGKKASSPQAKYLFSSSLTLSPFFSFKQNPQTIMIPRDKGESHQRCGYLSYGLKQTGDAIRWRKITLHGAEREETNTAAPDCDAPGHDTVGKIPVSCL